MPCNSKHQTLPGLSIMKTCPTRALQNALQGIFDIQRGIIPNKQGIRPKPLGPGLRVLPLKHANPQ